MSLKMCFQPLIRIIYTVFHDGANLARLTITSLTQFWRKVTSFTHFTN